MNKNTRFYVARRQCCGCIAAVVIDDDMLPDIDKAEMVRGCIESGLKIDRMSLDQITAIFLAQKDCDHNLDNDFPFEDDDSDDDIPF